MPWCNLYSNASKYNINVKESRYKLAVYSALAIIIFLVILVSYTFYYTLAQSVAVVGIISLSVFLSMSNNTPLKTSLTLTNTGSIHFHNEQTSYQLLADSRFSFIGCWLVMIEVSPRPNSSIMIPKQISKQLFIFRDSINESDFSRIARVIKQLE